MVCKRKGIEGSVQGTVPAFVCRYGVTPPTKDRLVGLCTWSEVVASRMLSGLAECSEFIGGANEC